MNQSLKEWERIERIKSKISHKLDTFISVFKQENSNETTSCLRKLKSMLVAFTDEERLLFVIIHSSRKCDVQRTLFDIIKKHKSPKSEGCEIPMIMDIIQGFCLMHYDSKKRVARKQRLNVKYIV